MRIWDFNADGSPPRDGGYDTNRQRRQTHGNVILEVFNLLDENPFFEHHLVERDCRALNDLYIRDFNIVGSQGFDYFCPLFNKLGAANLLLPLAMLIE